MVGSHTDFVFGEDLKVNLSLTVSDSFNEALKNVSMVTEKSEMKTEEYQAQPCMECSKTFITSKRAAASFFTKTQQKSSSHFWL